MKYLVKLSKKRHTLSMHMDHDGNLVVNAPASTSLSDIEKFVRSHMDWVREKMREREAGPKFSDGERVEIMGEMYTVATGSRAKLEKELLCLPSENREAALIALLRMLTRQRMKAYLDELCEKYGFSYTRLAVTSARGRWGSCSAKGHISFSFRGAFLPDELAYYLAVHELCHTRSMDHSARFWAEVKSILPDFRSRRAKLKEYLWAVNCL